MSEYQYLAFRAIDRPLTDKEVRVLLRQFALGNPAEARANILKRQRDEFPVPSWPTSKGTRTFEQLFAKTEQLRAEEDAKDLNVESRIHPMGLFKREKDYAALFAMECERDSIEFK